MNAPEDSARAEPSSSSSTGDAPTVEAPESALRSLGIGFVVSLFVVGGYAAWRAWSDQTAPDELTVSADPPEVADPPSEAESPGRAAPAEGAAATTLVGEVLEVIEVTAYTYLRVESAQGEFWAAVAKTTLQEGQQVSLADPLPMRGFHSKELDRDFELIYFSRLQNPNAASY